ncbi:spindle and kinetochore-associated protein 1-like isoform X1 [Lingula anatina]|uniref:SKA complex subunit 1 n=2 Tax=Lingula anatina TaxID=7574 RepID=A0A1S3HHR1_LINAN|nr:spindle and kinetochore-associated protein 1-like isoform X1 [Lingula anatina]|eukprot:XP_013385643.1 spindle and kinetochore-associated protein 1-like isoform X1 [Lingula anatina]
MNSCTVMELASQFGDKIQNLKNCFKLQACSGDVNCQQLLTGIDKDICELEVLMALMRAEVAREKENLKSLEVLKEQVLDLQKNLHYANDNLPQRLPQKKVCTKNEASENGTTGSPLGSKKDAVSSENGMVVQGARKRTRPPVPAIEYLTKDEYEEVPKYIKGRINYDSVNLAIDELNKAVSAKYSIVGKPRSVIMKSSDAIKKQFDQFKSQETKETKGVHFIVDGDIKSLSSLKMDSSARSVLTILRHCGRIKEIRGGGCTRYCVCV